MDRTTETLARFATTLRYADLGAPAIQAAKRRLIDSLGCAIGGHGSEPAAIARRLAPVWNGAPSARLLDASDAADEARFTRAVGADDGDELAGFGGNRNAVQSLGVAVKQVELLDFEDHSASSPR